MDISSKDCKKPSQSSALSEGDNKTLPLMGKILNIGSLNIDYVYNVNLFVQPGETISSSGYTKFMGGKGANQSAAIAKAGVNVTHAGRIGNDGEFLKDKLKKTGVNTELIETLDMPTGHAIIQVADSGENSIILHGGANTSLDETFINRVFDLFEKNDVLLTQNETNLVPLILNKAAEKEMFVIFNPAPMTLNVKSYPLDKVDMLIINETEGALLTGFNNPKDIISSLVKSYPKTRLVLTLGKDGVIFQYREMNFYIEACDVEVVDTTAAGDTFIGYLIAGMMSSENNIETALRSAAFAAEICVQKKGAFDSIPYKSEL